MNSVVLSKTYPQPPFCEREVLRYAGGKEADKEVVALMNACLQEAKDKLSYKFCYRIFSVKTEYELCDFGAFLLRSKDLAVNLKNCRRVILFAATVGIELDRLIVKYSRISPARSLMMQAIGAERVEALCDAFCADMAKETNADLRPRFSPGYGDLPLVCQKEIFSLLDCGKRIGLSLNDSLLMAPSKSVTAFIGII